jgi:hypothetical protein
MRRISLTFLGLAAAVALSSCSAVSPDSESLGGLLMKTARGAIGGGGDQSATSPGATAAQKALNRIAEAGTPGLLTTVPRLNLTTVMILEQESDGYRTFRGANNTSVTLRSGIVTETRGIGVDLMAQALSQPESSLFTTGTFPKDVARVQRNLDGENLLLSAEFLCVIERKEPEEITIIDKTHATTRFDETCKNSKRAFLNRYWVGSATGTVWQSQQSVSGVSGHIITQYIAGR